MKIQRFQRLLVWWTRRGSPPASHCLSGLLLAGCFLDSHNARLRNARYTRLRRSLAVNARALAGSNPLFHIKKPKTGLMACFRFLVDPKGFAACFAWPFRPSARRLLPRLAGSSSDRSLPRLHRSLAVNARALTGSNPYFISKNQKQALWPAFGFWWTRRGSNPRPPRCERGALPTELRARIVGSRRIAGEPILLTYIILHLKHGFIKLFKLIQYRFY